MTHESEPLGTAVPEGFLRLRGNVAYDGSDFAGWGIQPDRRTVQGDLEIALSNVLRSPRMHVQCAGRTDAGVHATGQVFHVDVPVSDYPGAQRVEYRLRQVLAEDIVVFDVREAQPGFDARYAALSRSYEYLIGEGPVRPLMRKYVHTHGWPIDLEIMQQASPVLLGLNDFTAFCRPREHGTSIRDLQEFSWHRREDGIIAARVRADAFCYSMVRMMVGAVLDIGAGRKPAQWLRGYLEGRTRDSSVFVAPAHGLTLTSVEYPPDDQLALRVERTRRRRIAGDPDS